MPKYLWCAGRRIRITDDASQSQVKISGRRGRTPWKMSTKVVGSWARVPSLMLKLPEKKVCARTHERMWGPMGCKHSWRDPMHEKMGTHGM